METDEPDNTCKKISIIGANNKYQMKKMSDKKVKERKKRIETEKWDYLDAEYLHVDKQKDLLLSLKTYLESGEDSLNKLLKTKENGLLKRQLERKIASYKQQDIEKKILDVANLVSLSNVITHLLQSEMKCFYCQEEMYLLYEIVRESRQWTLDRVDNDKGHNNDNVIIACLECNLKRRRRSKEAFFFTKNLVIQKMDA